MNGGLFMSKIKNEKAKRTRHFATVVYPESAPMDWIERLDAYHVATLISPLHDKDVNPVWGEEKIALSCSRYVWWSKDFDTQVKPIFDEIGGWGEKWLIHLISWIRSISLPSRQSGKGTIFAFGCALHGWSKFLRDNKFTNRWFENDSWDLWVLSTKWNL